MGAAAEQEPAKTSATANAEYTEAVRVANQIFSLVQTHQTPPVPKAYELLYSYATTDNEALRKSVETTLEKTGTLSVYDIDQIHRAHLTPEDTSGNTAEAVSKQMETELVDVMELVQSSLTSNEGFSESLDKAQAYLPHAGKPDQIRKIVDGLIAENQKMQRETSELSKRLAQSKSQIEELHGHLAEARASSMRDPLTTLGNRRHFDEALLVEMTAARESDEPLCLAIADLDHFKRVNDTFGHLIGDGILKTFAMILSNSIKGRDTAARYGGEEFAVILPQTSIKDAYGLIDQIRQKMEESNLVIKSTGQEVGTVTASFGIAQFAEDDTSETLISRADEFLYKAKKTGRNRIVTD